ncbi:hypothetical protein B2M20_17990 [Nitrobacter vulgaris]|uniref:Lipoprotein n=1 Tax=Nitrobacter vulgaris TaxID=29421 RepID=A0A1V4HTX1_NITVU|nr:hypothetical protein B2M20_17990 [Nitrobacter vulgaris]
MRTVLALLVVAFTALALAGCAYKPLKAPCSPDEGGTPLAYSDVAPPTVPGAFQHLDRCGPMRPI